MGCLPNLDNVEFFDTLEVHRIGKEKAGIPRLVKVKLPSSAIRNEILNKASTLQRLSEPWSKVYIKKDLHPVYLKENKRQAKKMSDLRNNPDNQNKNIKIVGGKLLVDEVVVDKNTFFV